MAKRPEGLSPNFQSTVSPDVPNSFVFKWTFIPETNDTQTAATVKVYRVSPASTIITASVTTEQRINLYSYQSSFVLNQYYEWEVIVTSSNGTTASSGRKSFIYTTVSSSSSLSWPDGPDPYEYIGTHQYFSEIKTNLLSLLNEYVNDTSEEQEALTRTNALFTGEILPSRTDFQSLEWILHLLATKENSYKDEVDQLIEDGLGAEDLHKIYTFIDRFTHIPPKAPTNISLSFTGVTNLTIASGTAANNGLEDLSVDLSWSPSSLTKGACVISFGNEPSEDVSYYLINIRAGFNDYQVVHEQLLYRISDIDGLGNTISIPMDHIDFHHKSTSKVTQYKVEAQVFDKRHQGSPPFSVTEISSNVSLGVSNYQISCLQNNLTDGWAVVGWHEIYYGNGTSYTHNATGTLEGKYHYSVRLFDINPNLSSPWYDFPQIITIDPLKPPAAPAPYFVSSTQTEVYFDWTDVATAESYEIDPQWGADVIWTTTESKSDIIGAVPGTTYTINVRAKNRAGSSAWASASGSTQQKPIQEWYNTGVGSRLWRGSATIYEQNGNTRYWNPRWATEYDGVEVFHGEWVETTYKKESGYNVKPGTHWGENKSIIFLDHASWRSKLAGKQILDVQMYLHREAFQHGYYGDGRVIHVWAHNYAGTWELPAASTGPSLFGQHSLTDLNFPLNTGHWFKLPISYGEGLRDNWIKGVALYHPNSASTPYEYIRCDTGSIQFYVKYQ